MTPLCFSEFQYTISAYQELSHALSLLAQTSDGAAAAEAPLRRLATPRAGEADEAPLPPLSQVLEKKQNREMNDIEPS